MLMFVGISGVDVCLQESVVLMFVGISGVDVCLQESVVLMFVCGNQWC